MSPAHEIGVNQKVISYRLFFARAQEIRSQ
jgi:hypothetical protein